MHKLFGRSIILIQDYPESTTTWAEVVQLLDNFSQLWIDCNLNGMNIGRERIELHNTSFNSENSQFVRYCNAKSQ